MDRSGAPTPRRAYRSEQRAAKARLTRQRVVEAAAATFLERGYAAATVRLIATRAGVAVPTVESLFGTKARLLAATIDVAIAGDDEPVPLLDRPWTDAALAAGDARGLLDIAAAVVAPAQQRSAGLVLAAIEGGATDPVLDELAAELMARRERTAAWLIDRLAAVADLRPGCSRDEAVETLWLLMEPSVFDRLVRHRHWTVERYQRWFARSAIHLLVADTTVEEREDTNEEHPP
jgi:AcrR family transcriptional regulator